MARFAGLRRTVRIGLQFQRASFRSAAQYRVNLVVMVALGVVYQGSGFAFVWVVFQRFDAIAGWTFAEVAFLYGLRLVAHAAYLLPLNSLTAVDWIIREGDFDRYLLRPLNPVVQLMTTRGMRMGAAGDLITGLAILITASRMTNVDWTVASVTFVLLAIIGGALIEAAIQLGLSAASFRLLSTFELRNFVDDIFGRFGSYPLKIFGAGPEWLLTFVLPVAFVAYVPASTLLNANTEGGLQLASWVAYSTPALGLLLFALAYRFWKGQLRHYQSVGH